MTVTPSTDPFDINYDEVKVGPLVLPNALELSPQPPALGLKTHWESQRRADIIGLFQDHVYGKKITLPAARCVYESPPAALPDGGGTWQTIHLEWAGRTVHILLVLPHTPTPAPVFVGYNFCGNHSITTSLPLPLSERWANASVSLHKADATACTVKEGRFMPASRGIRAHQWPEQQIVEAGCGFATMYYGDILEDNPTAYEHFIAQHFPHESVGAYSALGVWAAGLCAIRSFLSTRPSLGPLLAFGHSRLGKAALWAAALDPEFSMVFSNNSGKGGASLTRRIYGETITALTTRFPHWFCQQYGTYAGRETSLPIDQHLLLSLIAPRPLYVASAQDDQWADPRGEFLALRHAHDVYRLYTDDLFTQHDIPALETPLHSRLGYHYRRGEHDVLAYDWVHYLAFVKRFFSHT